MPKIMTTLFIICILSISPVYGESNSRSDSDVLVPPGMEVIQQGDVNVVVPKGSKLNKQGSITLIETADEYASRKFQDAEGRFKKIEKELDVQKGEIEDLKSAVSRLEEDARKK